MAWKHTFGGLAVIAFTAASAGWGFAASGDNHPPPPKAATHPMASRDKDCTTCEGQQLFNERQFDRARRIFERRATKGDGGVMNDLGWIYEYGLGVRIDLRRSGPGFSRLTDFGDSA